MWMAAETSVQIDQSAHEHADSQFGTAETAAQMRAPHRSGGVRNEDRMNPRHSASRMLALTALLPVLLVGLQRPLDAQTTYTSYDFTTLAGTAGVPGGADGTGPDARFTFPEGLVVAGSGILYVAEISNCTVRAIAPGGGVTTLAGMPGMKGSADGSGGAAQFYYPCGVAVDASGNLNVADLLNCTLRKVTPAGVVTTFAGTAWVRGSADGTGPAAQFYYPSFVAADGSGNLYVSDTNNNTIRKVTPVGVVTTLAGTAGTHGSADGSGGAAQFSSPTGIAVDANGTLYVSDQGNNTIRKITPAGAVTTLAGKPGTGGSADGTGPAALFSSPTGIAVDGSGNVFVADQGNDTIRRITPAGVVTTVAGMPGVKGGADGTGPASLFFSPTGVAVDSGGNLYVADSSNDTIRIGRFAGPQSQATVALGNLYQSFDGNPKRVSVTTSPAGLATLVSYNGSLTVPTGIGSYTVFAAISDPNCTGTASGTLTIGPGLSGQPSFVIRNTRAGGNMLRGIAAGPAGLVAVGEQGTILTSTNGSTWTRRVSGTTDRLSGVTFGAGQYVAVGDNGRVLHSGDGSTWFATQPATTSPLDNVVYAIGQYVAVGDGGTIVTSPDGLAWTARNSGVSGWLRGVAYTDFVSYRSDYSTAAVSAGFLATGQGGVFVSSTDGATWSQEFAGFGDDLEALFFPQWSDVVAVGANGAMAFGDRGFAEGSIFMPVRFRGLAQAGGALFAAGENGTIVTAPAYSGHWPKGGAWTQLSSGTTANLMACAAVGDSVFIVGENETILQSTQPRESRLINLSCRAQVGTGANILITGFVVGGQGTSGSEPLLVRGSGPALVPFDVSGALPDPKLQLYSTTSGSTLVATNTAWKGASEISSAAAALGAFAWADPSSHDAALFDTLAPGSYTANISGTSADTGVALAEIYDATDAGAVTATSPRLVNISARSQAGSGSNSLIAGFVIGGSTPKTVLIRASGPALIPFGVSGTLPDPELQVYSTASGSNLLESNTGWGGDVRIATAAAWVGAFSWGSAATPDSAVLVTLPPGPYTANVLGAGGDTGVALIEIYEVE